MIDSPGAAVMSSDSTQQSNAVVVEEGKEQGGTMPLSHPVHIRGRVVPGFQRGSKLLGIPTANLPAAPYEQQLENLDEGVYIGYANVSLGPVYPTVLSIGRNPFFRNKMKTIEPHILHKFGEDFYGEELRLSIVGYIRPQEMYTSLDDLIAAIKNDVRVAEKALSLPSYVEEKSSTFFVDAQLEPLEAMPSSS